MREVENNKVGTVTPALNNDHKIVHQATVTACRPIPGLSVSRLLMYEVLSSTDWGSMFFSPTFSPNFFVDIDAKMEAKLGAFDFYETEKRNR